MLIDVLKAKIRQVIAEIWISKDFESSSFPYNGFSHFLACFYMFTQFDESDSHRFKKLLLNYSFANRFTETRLKNGHILRF